RRSVPGPGGRRAGMAPRRTRRRRARRGVGGGARGATPGGTPLRFRRGHRGPQPAPQAPPREDVEVESRGWYCGDLEAASGADEADIGGGVAVGDERFGDREGRVDVTAGPAAGD